MPALSRVAAGVPRPEAHLELQRRARVQAARLVSHWHGLPARHPERFDLWFTYHCYYRKPDWLGPLVTRALGIVTCERNKYGHMTATDLVSKKTATVTFPSGQTARIQKLP